MQFVLIRALFANALLQEGLEPIDDSPVVPLQLADELTDAVQRISKPPLINMGLQGLFGGGDKGLAHIPHLVGGQLAKYALEPSMQLSVVFKRKAVKVCYAALQLVNAFEGAIGRAGLLSDSEFSGNGVPLRDALLRFDAPIDSLLHKFPIGGALGLGTQNSDDSNELASFAFAKGQSKGALAVHLPRDGIFEVRVEFGVLRHFDRLRDKTMAAVFQAGDVLARLQKRREQQIVGLHIAKVSADHVEHRLRRLR